MNDHYAAKVLRELAEALEGDPDERMLQEALDKGAKALVEVVRLKRDVAAA